MTKQQAQALCRARALTEVGFCPFSAVAAHLLPCRASARLPDGAATVMVVLFPYRFADDTPRNLSRYACVPDYHVAAGAVLKELAQALREADPAHRFEPFIDNSPLPEVAAAVMAGLGCRGDNGLLLHPRFGSYVFIGAIVSDWDAGATAHPLTDCRHCGACARACPSDALTDKGRCFSAVTQRKGTLSPAEERLIRETGSVWGCDRCQEVCPANRDAVCAPHPCFSWYHPQLTADDLDDLSDKAYGWRGAAVPRRNLDIIHR